MFKYDIEYTNFNEEKKTKTYYFHLSEVDLTELIVEHNEGFEAFIKRIAEAEDTKTMYAEFKRIVLMSSGEKSADGESFVKNGEAFIATAAFTALMHKLTTDSDFAAVFMAGIVPTQVREEAAKIELERKTAEKLGITKSDPEVKSAPEETTTDADLSM